MSWLRGHPQARARRCLLGPLWVMDAKKGRMVQDVLYSVEQNRLLIAFLGVLQNARLSGCFANKWHGVPGVFDEPGAERYSVPRVCVCLAREPSTEYQVFLVSPASCSPEDKQRCLCTFESP
jgi:hypothetical protein